ncbi:MAG: FKBP-type peptidyl-prolyl cis-trans isomerase [Bacteroidales bacterium]|nr:FKBP-type peptidyl-prolyl cis-trans isomerase [Bacteroidales bacterium]
MIKRLLYIVIVAITIVSCSSQNKQDTDKVPYSQLKNEKKEQSIGINQDMIEVNKDVIEKYISRHKWDMTITESGLYYMIYKQNDDVKVNSGDEVEFSFKTSLMNGDVLYDSDATGNRKMKIDNNQEESGLNEGLKLMRKGEKAYFILPPHLAFGVAGDSYRIPPYSVLVYDIEVVDVKAADNADNDNIVL